MNSNQDGPDPEKGSAVGILLDATTGDTVTVKNIRHTNPLERIPAGRIEAGETIEDALVREIWEETGLIIQQRKWLMRVLSRNKAHYYHVFACPLPNFDGLKTEPVVDGDELLICQRREPALLINDKTLMVPHHRIMLDVGIQKIRRL